MKECGIYNQVFRERSMKIAQFKIKPLVYCLLFTVLFACGGTLYRVSTIHDDFDNYTVIQMNNNFLDGGSAFTGGGQLSLNLTKIIETDTVYYNIIAEYIGTSWLFISEGESLVMLVDGKRIGFNGSGSSMNRNIYIGGTVIECAYYSIDVSTIEKIVNATEIKVKIRGDRRFERHFSDYTFTNIRSFYAEYIKDQH